MSEILRGIIIYLNYILKVEDKSRGKGKDKVEDKSRGKGKDEVEDKSRGKEKIMWKIKVEEKEKKWSIIEERKK